MTANPIIPDSDSCTQPNNFYDDMALLLGNRHVSALDVVSHIQHWVNNEQWIMSLSSSEFDGFMVVIYRALTIVRSTVRAEESESVE